MKAALRDAKRAEAIVARPRGSTMAHAALGRTETPSHATCYVCATPMNNAKGRATGGICGGCMGHARQKRDEVRRQRATWERAERRRSAANVKPPRTPEGFAP